MLDQLAVLEWVQREIGAFGGDPERVTLGGQSAGAGSVADLLVSPLSDGLFAQAILHSPPLPEAGNDPARRARWERDLAVDRSMPAAGVVARHEALLREGECIGTRGAALPAGSRSCSAARGSRGLLACDRPRASSPGRRRRRSGREAASGSSSPPPRTRGRSSGVDRAERRGAARRGPGRRSRRLGGRHPDVRHRVEPVVVLPNSTALALADHAAVAGTASALLGVIQFSVGARGAARRAGGTDSAVPMAAVMTAVACAALLARQAAGARLAWRTR